MLIALNTNKRARPRARARTPASLPTRLSGLSFEAARSPARARASYDVNDIVRLIVGPRGSVVTLDLAVVRDEEPAPGRDRLDP